MAMPLITLTTDFGNRDWFVGTMKGVILGINPDATVIDLTHEVPAGDVRAGAFSLAAAYGYFPRGTIHVAIIDPGVGSPRPAVAIKTANFTFVGPDNGVMSWALARETIRTRHRLENTRYFLPAISRTFHGRDVFAPVAAHLSCGTAIHRLGSRVDHHLSLEFPEPVVTGNRIQGEILHADVFGNLFTNINEAILQAQGWPAWSVHARGQKLCDGGLFYAQVPKGQPIALIGSAGWVEIAINQGSAGSSFQLHPGDPVAIHPAG
jgi:S-adenosylmethionine hydrolase